MDRLNLIFEFMANDKRLHVKNFIACADKLKVRIAGHGLPRPADTN